MIDSISQINSYINVLITGGTGFIGGSVLRRLCYEKYITTFTYRNKINILPLNARRCVINNINKKTDWFNALQNQDIVLHCAGLAHIINEREFNPAQIFNEVNVEGTLNLARQAVASGVNRFVFLSSIGVNGVKTEQGESFNELNIPNPHNYYSQSKLEAEQGLLRISNESGLEVVIIRPPLVYGYNAPGNFGSLKRAVQRGWPLPLGAVQNQRSLLALDNLVDFIITCINHPQAANQTFLVSDGQDLSTTELVRGMAQAAGVTARLLPVPVWALQAGALFLGKGEAVQSLCGNLQVDISKARSLLGWVPPVSVEEGLRRAMGKGMDSCLRRNDG